MGGTPSLTTSEGHDDKFRSLTDVEVSRDARRFDESGAQDKLKLDLGESKRSGRWFDEGFRSTVNNFLGVDASAHPLNEKEIKERHAELSRMVN
ncbi:hypothetical protein K523DRAFT_383827 [Schizophyllum commune Tattone D]|nr:hypothetical protein K523DRAFT_383827 [Schizophyllum commune Tattone D]